MIPTQEPLLDKGFYYLVKKDLFHLKAGMKVKVLRAEYFHASSRGDERSGFLILFPDKESVLLNRKKSRNVGVYFEKQEPFDLHQAMKEVNDNTFKQLLRVRKKIESDTYTRNKKMEGLVHELVAKGMTPKEAYKYILKNKLDEL